MLGNFLGEAPFLQNIDDSTFNGGLPLDGNLLFFTSASGNKKLSSAYAVLEGLFKFFISFYEW